MNIFTVQVDSDDIEAAMHEVSQAVAAWEGGKTHPLTFSLACRGEGEVLQQVRRLQLQWNIDANAIIHSTRPGLGPWIIRFQTLVRRATWWFLEPILQQIRAFQMNVARVIESLAENQAALMADNPERQGVREEERLTALEAELKVLKSRLEYLEGVDGG